MEMAASGCSTALLPLPRNGILFVSPSSVAQSHHSSLFEFSLRTERRLVARKSYNPFRVSCIGESKPAVVTGKSWDKQVLKSEAPVLVEFYASWCGPCRMVHRVIEEISTEYSGRLNCFILDADKDLSVAENHDIKAVPVVLLFKNGEKRESIIGTMPKEFYVSAIERLLAS